MLFLVGEKRRDVIPKMLQDPPVAEEEEEEEGRIDPQVKDRKRIKVDEMVVYQSGELEEFEFSFQQTMSRTEPAAGTVRWVVLFSPTAGRGVLKGLGWWDDETGRARKDLEDRRTFVACIGPTTKGYLWEQFGFEADVVAGSPSPEGLKDAIVHFMREKQYFEPRTEIEGRQAITQNNVNVGEGVAEK